MADHSLATRVQRARALVAVHKAALRHHRAHLQQAAAALTAIEAECRRLGIAVAVRAPVPVSGTGEVHSHAAPDIRSDH